MTVGNGGSGSSNPSLRGGAGEDSKIESLHFPNLISKGGGGGGSANAGNIPGDDQRAGGIGGSGGGGVSRNILGGQPIPISAGINTGTGFRGGHGAGSNNDNPTGGGGGGGVNQEGETPSATQAGNGGNGRTYPNLTNGLITFVPQGFAAGGGGIGGNSNNLWPQENEPNNGGFAGGVMIGGRGINLNNGGDGLTNTGSGGGAGGALETNNFRGGNGGSGIVIIRYEIVKILPVEFAYYDAQFLRQTRSTVISWATAKEWESSHFEIERATRGMNFQKIGEVDAVGWSDSVVEYKFEDSNLPLSGGNVLYRLKQVDLNGKFAYTSVMSTRVPGTEFTQGVWRAFPNPTNGSAFNIGLLDRSQYEDEPLTFRLVHPLVQTASISVNTEMEMNQQLAQHISRMPNGVFVVEIQWGRKIEHIKVMKK